MLGANLGQQKRPKRGEEGQVEEHSFTSSSFSRITSTSLLSLPTFSSSVLSIINHKIAPKDIPRQKAECKTKTKVVT